MEATASAPTNLPNGVQAVGGSTPPPAQPMPQQQAPPMAPAPTDTPAPSSAANWNWLEIGAAIIITTGFLFSIYYFRYKTKVLPEKIKDQDAKISSLAAEIDEMKNPVV